MPCSHPAQINEIVKVLLTVDPKSVLDIGVGYGKYGFLSREFLDIAKQSDKPYKEIKHTVRIDGIEIYEDYITQHHRIFYDNIYIGNANEVFDKSFKNYDLVLLIDVLEHFSREDGMKLIKKIKASAANILISTPKIVQEQGEEYGNVHETHRYEWKPEDYEVFPDRTFLKNDYSLICFVGKDKDKVKSAFSDFDKFRGNFKNKFSLVSFKIFVAKKFPFIKAFYKKLFK